MDQRAHRMPTSVLVVAGLVLLVVGAVWWSGAAPELSPASARPPASASASASASPSAPAEESAYDSVLVLQMGDGTVVVDEDGVSTLYRGMRQPDTGARPLLGGQLLCRIGGRDSILEELAAGDLHAGSGLLRVPRCGRPHR